jgi:hypothetical protein
VDEKTFTPEEAGRLLPQVARSLLLIREARQVVLSGGERIRTRAALNGGGRDHTEHSEALRILRREVEALTEMGVILRDPEKGLVDFPTRIEGREVFLCWQLGEDRVAYWHGPESGFSGRTALE